MRLMYRFRLLLFVAVVIAGVTSGARAQIRAIGATITIDRNVASKTVEQGNNFGGVNFDMHYTVTNGQTAFDPANLRWLQLVNSSANIGGITPDPNRRYIDPRNGTDIGNGVTGDDLPWYDATYPTADSTTENRGIGPFLHDNPAIDLRASPYRFDATTLLVSFNAANCQATFLGGVQWGYTLTGNGQVAANVPGNIIVRALNPTAVTFSPALATMFNTALALDFPKATGPQYTVVAPAPEASTILLLPLGLIGFGIYRRARHA